MPMDQSVAFPAIELLAQKELVIDELCLVLVPMPVEFALCFFENLISDDSRNDVVENVFFISGYASVFLVSQQP